MEVIAVIALAALLLLLRTMLDEAVRREYDRWAPSLARGIVRMAGVICPPRRDEWLNDILAVQALPEPHNESGLWAALEHLLEAPKTLVLQRLHGWRGDALPEGRPSTDEDQNFILVVPQIDAQRKKRGSRLHRAGCCRPSYPQPIIGYKASAGYISLHDPSCAALRTARQSTRSRGTIKAVWGEEVEPPIAVVLRVIVPLRTEVSALPALLEATGWKANWIYTQARSGGGFRELRIGLVAIIEYPSYAQALKALRSVGGDGLRIVGTPTANVTCGDPSLQPEISPEILQEWQLPR